VSKLIAQSGVIAVRAEQVCLVTSRSGGRWVIPKGKIESYQTPLEAARQEAWEEAGIVGDLLATSVGRFQYSKLQKDYEVTVFLMAVKLEAETWPEKAIRRREWVTSEEAARRVIEPDLQTLLLSLFRNARGD